MDAIVIIATKGRPVETARLLDALAGQSLPPQAIIVAGASAADLPQSAVAHLPLPCPRPGLTAQRNFALAHTRQKLPAPAFVAFFDDDFRPAPDWLEQAQRLFLAEATLAGITGHVLADGINGAAIGEDEAAALISGAQPPQPHWSSGPARQTSSVYGCNMAFADRVWRTCNLDENLPLYGWQEDRDYTGQALALGRVMIRPECRGVHLGVKGARVSGRRFGYSQIANPVYLMRKGTMDGASGRRFLWRALAANAARSATRDARADYRGRLAGNLAALADMVRGRCHPTNVLRQG